MVKKGSKARRTSVTPATATLTSDSNITIINSNEIEHSKFSVIRSNNDLSNTTAPLPKVNYDELKEECTTSEDIRSKVRRLPVDIVLPLLTELLDRFDVQQARDAILTEWIKTVLLIHTAYFMTLPSIVSRLSGLYKELDDRLTVYPKLLAMKGRLDLVQSQIDARNRVKDESDDDDIEESMSSSDSEDDIHDEAEDGFDDEDEDNDEEEQQEDSMDMNNEEIEMFAEEEEDLSTEDEDDNISDSDVEDLED